MDPNETSTENGEPISRIVRLRLLDSIGDVFPLFLEWLIIMVMIRAQIWRLAIVAISFHFFSDSFVVAQGYKTQVGFDKLRNEVGPTLANGSGITVGLVEANTGGAGTNTYFPNVSIPEFALKTFVDESNLSPRNTSVHSTLTGQFFFGSSTSMSPGVTNIRVYDAENFVGVKQALGAAGTNPVATSFSVVNHSYIGTVSAGFPTSLAVEANARLDYTITRDNFTSAVALNNGVGSLPAIYGQSYNSIVVGRSDGLHSFGLTTLGVAGRTKPDIVAPSGTTSGATPIVSSAATLLHSAANDFGMTNARNSEAMKAIIMAGASKDPFPTWSNTTTQPLDSKFGAGEVNVYNSYKILQAGESNGVITIPVANSNLKGWDYGPSIDPTTPMYWNINVGQTVTEASILLDWNAKYQDGSGNFNSTLSLANMDLKLFDSTTSFLGTEIVSSRSLVDNIEHIYLRNLNAGLYTIQVSSTANSAFGLAWNFTAVPEPSSIALLGVCSLFLLMRAPAAKKSLVRLLSNRCVRGDFFGSVSPILDVPQQVSHVACGDLSLDPFGHERSS